jgi:hypothetical protein
VGYSSKSKLSIFYPDVPSVKKPISHDFIPIPKLPKEWTVDEIEPSSASLDDEPELHSLGLQNFVAFFANGTAGQKINIITLWIGPYEKT